MNNHDYINENKLRLEYRRMLRDWLEEGTLLENLAIEIIEAEDDGNTAVWDINRIMVRIRTQMLEQ
jgi:hypothetical protein